MEEEGFVIGIPGPGTAEVKMVRSAACASCGACGLCHSFEGSENEMVAEVNDSIGVKPGQKVLIMLPAAAVLKASLAVYILPLAVLLTVGLSVQYLASGFLSPGNAQLASLLSGLGGLVATFVILRRIFKKRSDRSLRPSIINVL